MTSNKPYLIRAFHEWISDNQLTPYLMVDARYPGVDVPASVVDEEGKVVFNISWQAVHGLDMGNEEIHFDARFSGVSHLVCIPVQAVMAIYARENGAGTLFDVEPAPGKDEVDSEAETAAEQPRQGGLRLVKD